MRIGTAAAPQADLAVQSGAADVQQQAGAEGAFAQLLMQLFGSMELSGETGGEELPAQALPEKESKESNAAAMQMMAELLAANGMPWQAAALSTEENAAAAMQLAGISAENGGAPELLNALAFQQAAPVAQETVELPQGLTQAPSLRNLFAELAEAKEDGQEALSEAIPVAVEKGGPAEETELFHGQMQFRQSVAEARKALKEETKPSGNEPVDVDALQQKVDAERPGMATALREKTYDLQQRGSVVGQMKDHILKNLSEGNNEFTVKLKPESLGEITVKLVKNDGRISMSIVTASTQTAKLLNESAEALKSSLRPLQAEIREIVPRTEQAADAQQGGLFGNGFESFQHQQQFTQREQPQYYGGPSYAQGEDAADEEAAAEPALSGTDRLNAYI